MIFVSSWDDGHPLDARLGDLLDKWGLRATFYVPGSNREGRTVMRPEAIRTLYAGSFEIASHTRDHVYLTTLGHWERMRQLREGKAELEAILGQPVTGFCYPGGKFNRRIRQEVMDAGFTHARTVENLRLDKGSDLFRLPTTVQFYPHRYTVLLRNFLSGGHYIRRAPALRSLVGTGDWLVALKTLADMYADTPAVFHLWGHSWEIDQCGLWSHLDDFLGHIASLSPVRMSVGELTAHLFDGNSRG